MFNSLEVDIETKSKAKLLENDMELQSQRILEMEEAMENYT